MTSDPHNKKEIKSGAEILRKNEGEKQEAKL